MSLNVKGAIKVQWKFKGLLRGDVSILHVCFVLQSTSGLLGALWVKWSAAVYYFLEQIVSFDAIFAVVFGVMSLFQTLSLCSTVAFYAFIVFSWVWCHVGVHCTDITWQTVLILGVYQWLMMLDAFAKKIPKLSLAPYTLALNCRVLPKIEEGFYRSWHILSPICLQQLNTCYHNILADPHITLLCSYQERTVVWCAQFVVLTRDVIRHRPVEQDHRAAGHAVIGLHEVPAAHRAQLRRESPASRRLLVRQALSRHAVSGREQRAQRPARYHGTWPAEQDASHWSHATHQRRRRAESSLHQCVVRHQRSQRGTCLNVFIA